MCTKFKYEFVKQEFEKEGYTLLSDYYIDSRQKLGYICPESHKSSVSFGAWFNKGHRCKKCADEKLRLNLNFIKSEFEKENYELLTKTYKNSLQKLKYICPKGHLRSVTWGNWKSGCRCAVCAKNVKHTIEFIRSEFKKENYILITNKYINQKQKLDYICPNGHKHFITWTDWYNGGCRCPTCKAINMMGDGNYQWKGGKSYDGYCPIWKTNGYRDSIKERDGYMCLNPYCDINKSYDLTVHHIDYDKSNCGKNNLITLCRSCNSRANIDRKWHTSWYNAIMSRRYNYKY